MHIFALAQVLRRPIVLLDRVSAVSPTPATFLPVPSLCPVLDPLLKRIPLFIAWSSAAKNHFVPVCPVLAPGTNGAVRFPRHLLPDVWGAADGVEMDVLSFFQLDETGNFILVSPSFDPAVTLVAFFLFFFFLFYKVILRLVALTFFLL